METTQAAAKSGFLTACMGVVFGVVLTFIFLVAIVWALIELIAGAIFAALLIGSICAVLLAGAHYLRWKKEIKAVSSYAKVGFEIFLEFRPGFVLLGLFLGAALASAPAGWLRYSVAFLVFAIALALYNDYQKERREERLAEKILTEKEQDGYSA